MKKLSQSLYSITNTKTLIIAIVIFALTIAVVLPIMDNYTTRATGVEESPDTTFFYSSDDLNAMTDSYGEAGRKAYIVSRFTFDLFFPLVYWFFLMVVLSALLKNIKPGSPLRLYNLMPIVAAGFDILENTGASIVMGRYPTPTPVIATVTPILSTIKWAGHVLSFGMIFILIVRLGILAIKNKTK